MQITALIQVINFLKEKSEDLALLEGYKRLADIVKDASSSQEGDSLSAIIKEKEQLKNVLLASDPSEWGYAAYNLLGKIDKTQIFGKAGADSLDSIITPASKEFKTIHSDLTKKIKHFSKLSETASRFLQSFEQVVPPELIKPDEEINTKSSLLLYFEGKLSVQSINDLERYARLWDGILGSFSKLTGDENFTLDIGSFHNGNIVLGVNIEENTLNSIMTGVTGMLNILDHILNIKKIQAELVQLPLYNNYNELLIDEIDGLINRKAEELTNNLIDDYYNSNIAKEEMATILICSLKQVLSFVEKGGKIEFQPLKSNPDYLNANKLLTHSFQTARELEIASILLSAVLKQKEETNNISEVSVAVTE